MAYMHLNILYPNLYIINTVFSVYESCGIVSCVVESDRAEHHLCLCT